MSWIDVIKRKISIKTTYAKMMNGYMPVFSQFGEDIYMSDVVQQAVKCIVDEMIKLAPCHARVSGDDIEPVNDSVQTVLDYPNPVMSKSAFLEKITWQLMYFYNAFIIPVYETWKDKNGNEKRNYKALYPVQPQNVEFREDAAGELYVTMKFANNYETTLPYSDVIHLRYRYSINEFMGGNENGRPNHKPLLKTLNINENLLNGVAGAVKSSFAINGILKYNTLMDKDQVMKENLKEFERQIQESGSGILPADQKAEYIPMKRDVKLVDADTLKFIDEKILRNWGVSLPILTGDYTKAQYEAFYQKTLEPLITSWGDEFSRVLFTDRQKQFGNRIIFFTKKLVFMSTEQTLEMVRLLGDSGSLYENEKRTAFGLMPLPELAGVRKQSLNYIDVEAAREYQLGAIGGKGREKKEVKEENEGNS